MSTEALFAPAVAIVTAPSGITWRVKRLSMLDLSAEDRIAGLRELLPLQAEGADALSGVQAAREALTAAEASGDALQIAAARDGVETAQASAGERLRAVLETVTRDAGILSGLLDRRAVLTCAAVTGCAVLEDPPGPDADPDSIEWTPCRLVRDRASEDRTAEPARAWVGRFDGDLDAISTATQWEGADRIASFRGVGSGRRA